MSLRLGLDDKIVPFTKGQVEDADVAFNKFVINTGELLAKGLMYGAVGSIFFLRKKPVIFYSAGFGVGYSFFRTFGSSLYGAKQL